MAAITQRVFSGINPKTDAELLGPAEAQVASNVRLNSGTLKASRLAVSVATIFKNNPQTIYRFGQYETDDSGFWFTFAGDVDVVKSAINGDTSERTYFTGDEYPKVTNLVLALTGGTDYPVAFLRLGVPRPTAAIFVTAPGTLENPPPPSEARVYVVVFVNSFAEQGAPSPASNLVIVYEGDSASLSNIPTPPSGNYSIPTKRIFRSASGASDAVFRFVAEIPAGQTTFTDNVATDDLGETLTTEDYDPPPDNLKGICLGANGVYAGFDGLDVYFTPPYLGFAWPTRYSLTMDSPIVGIAPMPQGFFVATKANPYLILGPDAESFNQVKYQDPWACSSKRSMVPMMGGVVYSSPDGLVLATEGGLRNLTEGILTREQWQAYQPETMHAYQNNGKYIVFYGSGPVKGSLIFDFSAKEALFTVSNDWYPAGYSDRFRDALYVANGLSVLKDDAGSAKTFRYRGKRHRVLKPTNFAFAQVIADAYPVTFRVFADGSLKHTETVLNSEPFRLPGGFLGNVWELEIEGTQEVRFVGIAQSTAELQQL